MLSAGATRFLDALADLDVTVDGEEIAAIVQGCETAIAKTIAPLRAFDELMLYRLTKASSTAQFLERCAGLSPRDARARMFLVRKLKAMPLTEAAWLAGTITSGQMHAIVDNVPKRLAEQYSADEAAVLAIIGGLDVKDTETAIQKWVHFTEASLDDEDPKPPREDEFFHSEAGGRYFSKGSFGSVTGKVINDAIGLAETDNPRDDDTRSPAERRGEALPRPRLPMAGLSQETDPLRRPSLLPPRKRWCEQSVPSCAAPPQRTGGSAAEPSCVTPWNRRNPPSPTPTDRPKPPNPQSDNPASPGTD
jgi:hypothetical protein